MLSRGGRHPNAKGVVSSRRVDPALLSLLVSRYSGRGRTGSLPRVHIIVPESPDPRTPDPVSAEAARLDDEDGRQGGSTDRDDVTRTVGARNRPRRNGRRDDHDPTRRPIESLSSDRHPDTEVVASRARARRGRTRRWVTRPRTPPALSVFRG